MQSAPPVIAIQSVRGGIFVGVGAVVALGAAAILFSFNPAENGFYPRCFFKLTTGLDCPGCGGLRATHQLLHGHIREALVLNPLFVLSLPLFGYFAARPIVAKFLGRNLPQLFSTITWAWIAGAAVISFGVLRNLPWRAWMH